MVRKTNRAYLEIPVLFEVPHIFDQNYYFTMPNGTYSAKIGHFLTDTPSQIRHVEIRGVTDVVLSR